MAALRRHVFVEKVLRRLFPSVPCGQEKRVLVAPASGNPAERVATTDLRGRSAPTLTGGDSKVPPRRRLYTASLPPEGYVPAPPEPQASPASEDSSGSDDAGKGCPLSGRVNKRHTCFGGCADVTLNLQIEVSPRRVSTSINSETLPYKCQEKVVSLYTDLSKSLIKGLETIKPKMGTRSLIRQGHKAGRVGASVSPERDGDSGPSGQTLPASSVVWPPSRGRGVQAAQWTRVSGAPEGVTCTVEAPTVPSPADQDFHDQPKRRRARKHKSKKNFKDPNNIHGEQEELEKQQSLLQEKLQPQCTDGPTISRNKKRKLKKKQQIKRKKAAGVITKASGVNFLYQPEQSDSERDVEHQSDGEDGADACGGDGADARGGDGADARGHCSTDTSEENHKDSNEEGVKSISEKAAGILNFLKSTQEIYFYDGICQDPGSAVLLETTQELFKHLDSHGLSPSDVLLLDHMKSLLLLQDTKGLRRALEMFPERCTLPADHARVLVAFFNYWITHVLPEKQ